jgi:XTP/dITP diphosphohydrolase
MRRLVIATTNQAKVQEIEEILAGVPFDLVTLARWSGVPAPEETGRTFADNARQKALHYAAATGELTVAEDSGLEIEALGGVPGVESARLGGTNATYAEKFVLIYEALRQQRAPTRAARFVCALALARSDRVVFEAQGTVDGLIAPEPRGEGGFGYDPIFFYPPFGRTLAEAPDRKREISHRGQAFRALRTFLEREPKSF